MLSLIHTNSQCISCNKCISTCPLIGANIAKEGQIVVNHNICIACGNCFRSCKHEAREYTDDWEVIKTRLKNKEPISFLVAPSFYTNYPETALNILGYLKSLGANQFLNVSVGADITTWAYLNYLTTNPIEGAISQPCPVIVNYIENHQPKLIQKLVPIHSPMMCSAIYWKKYMGITDDLVFLSPCMAKKEEISDPNTEQMICGNVTFQHLMDDINRTHINVKKYEEVQEVYPYGLGAIYPMPGGLKQNVEYFMGDSLWLRQVEGHGVYQFFQNYEKSIDKGEALPFMVDALNCEHGCLYGTGIENSKRDSDSGYYEVHKRKQLSGGKKNPFAPNVPLKKRLPLLNKMYNFLNIEDFKRQYTKKHKTARVISENELANIFLDMKKTTKESRHINCSACGYPGCHEMANAIAYGYNKKENCIHYIKAVVEEEKKEIIKLNSQTQAAQKQKIETYKQLVEQFAKLSSSIQELSSRNQKTSKDTIQMKEETENLYQYCEQVIKALDVVNEDVQGYEKNNTAINKISSQINTLSLNAAIEAARVGTYGAGFSVIANKIKALSVETKELTVESKKTSKKILPAIEHLVDETKQLYKVIEDFGKSIEAVTETSEKISEQSESISKDTSSLKEQMQHSIHVEL